MSNWKNVSNFVTLTTKGVTPTYVDHSSVIVLNQKCIRNNRIDYSFAQFNDDTKEIHPNKFVKEGDILVNSTGTGTAGRCAFVSKVPEKYKLIVDSHILILRCNSYYEAQCLSYELFSFEQKLMTLMTGSSGQSELDKVSLLNIMTKMPDKNEEQQSIASILSDIDNKIDLNNKINVELETMAKYLFDYWFVQFDFPDKNGKPYKSSGGKMIRSDELNKLIPKGWRVERLRDLILGAKNGDWGNENMGENVKKVFCIRGADINGLNGMVSFEPPIRYIEKSHVDRLLKKDDLIIEISGGSPVQSTGRMAHISQEVLSRLDDSVVCSNFCKAISLKNNKLSYLVSRYWDRLYEEAVFFNFEGKTSGIKNLLFDQLAKDVKIAIPNDENLINKYYEFEETLDKKKQNNLVQNQELIILRDWLLPMLMNGQVKINDKKI